MDQKKEYTQRYDLAVFVLIVKKYFKIWRE